MHTPPLFYQPSPTLSTQISTVTAVCILLRSPPIGLPCSVYRHYQLSDLGITPSICSSQPTFLSHSLHSIQSSLLRLSRSYTPRIMDPTSFLAASSFLSAKHAQYPYVTHFSYTCYLLPPTPIQHTHYLYTSRLLFCIRLLFHGPVLSFTLLLLNTASSLRVTHIHPQIIHWHHIFPPSTTKHRHIYAFTTLFILHGHNPHSKTYTNYDFHSSQALIHSWSFTLLHTTF